MGLKKNSIKKLLEKAQPNVVQLSQKSFRTKLIQLMAQSGLEAFVKIAQDAAKTKSRSGETAKREIGKQFGASVTLIELCWVTNCATSGLASYADRPAVD